LTTPDPHVHDLYVDELGKRGIQPRMEEVLAGADRA